MECEVGDRRVNWGGEGKKAGSGESIMGGWGMVGRNYWGWKKIGSRKGPEARNTARTPFLEGKVKTRTESRELIQIFK